MMHQVYFHNKIAFYGPLLGLLLALIRPLPAPAQANAPAELVFPLKISPDKRYLTDQQGKPFLYHADTGWMIFMHLTPDEARTYLLNRKEKGFTVIQAMLTGFADSVNRAGEAPFHDADFTRPNEAYFRNVDRVLQIADSLGLVMGIAPLWLGCCGEGYGGRGKAIERNGPDKSRRFGQFAGRRYSTFRNIIWLIGGDNDPHHDRESLRQLALGIRETAPAHLLTYHAASTHSSTDVWEADEPWLDVSMVYTYFRGFHKAWNKVQPDVYEVSYTEYRKTPVRPFFLGESTYEGEHDEMGSARQARKQAYWALLSGATGHAYGSPLWAFPPDWKRYLHLPGAGSLKHFHTLFSSVPWYRLVPDIMSTLVKDGAGAYAGNDYATAAITADKRLALIYIPSGRTLHLDLTQLAGKTVKATWFNPRSGERWVIKPPAHRPDAPFETPDADDWVLLLEAG